jgi:hypothetical protein
LFPFFYEIAEKSNLHNKQFCRYEENLHNKQLAGMKKISTNKQIAGIKTNNLKV